MPHSMVYANERGRALPRSPSEELRGRRGGGVGGRCVAYAAAGPEWREGGPKTQRKVHCTGEPSLPSFHLPRSAARSSFVWTGRRGEGRFIVDRSNSDRFSLVATRARSAGGVRALHFTARARLFSYFTVAIHCWRCCVTDEGGTPRPSYVTYDIITVGRPQACAAHPRTPYASLPRSLGGWLPTVPSGKCQPT